MLGRKKLQRQIEQAEADLKREAEKVKERDNLLKDLAIIYPAIAWPTEHAPAMNVGIGFQVTWDFRLDYKYRVDDIQKAVDLIKRKESFEKEAESEKEAAKLLAELRKAVK